MWAQEKVKGKLPIIVNGFSGDRPIIRQGMRPNLRTACVCHGCNHGWMSQLEGDSRRVLGPLMEDIHLTFNSDQQSTIVKWAVKTAMTGESFNRTNRKLFYTRDERTRFRESWQFPSHMLVWLARYGGMYDLGLFGIDSWDDDPGHADVTHAYITTIQMARVVIQVISIHAAAHLNNINLRLQPGPWDDGLLDLRPSNRGLAWPPLLTIRDAGGFTLKSVVGRFSVGAAPMRPLRPSE